MVDELDVMSRTAEASRLSRRRAVAGAGGIAVATLAVLAGSGGVLAQAGTPGPVTATYGASRTYQLAAGASVDELLGLVEEGFVPIIREIPGFVAYYIVVNRETGGWASLSLFTDQASAEASTAAAADWVAANVTRFLEGSPNVVAGEVGIAEVA